MNRLVVLLFLLVSVDGRSLVFGDEQDSVIVGKTDGIETVEEGQDLSTPQQTVKTHLMFLQPDNFHPEIAGRVFEGVEPGSPEGQKLALQLIQILDGKGLYVDLDDVPTNPNHLDSLNKKNKFVLFKSVPRIYLVKRANVWLYSERTVQAIPELHAEVYPFGTGRLLGLFPRKGQDRYFGLQVWQYAGVLILVVLSVLIHLILTWAIGVALTVLISRFGSKKIAQTFIRPVAKPVSLLAITIVLLVLVPVLQLPIKFNQYLTIGLKALMPVFLTLIVYRLVDLLGEFASRLADKTETSLDDHLVPLVRKIVKVIVVIAGVIFVLQNLNVNVTALAAILSVGALGLGLASQDSVRNLFGSIMIFLDRPFQIGDAINLGDVSGSVEEVGIRSTRIRTFHNSLVSVPNGKVADMTIDNMGSRVYRRFNMKIGVTYDTPPEKIEAFVEGLQQIIAQHPKSRKDSFEVRLNEFGDSALLILFYMFFQVPTWTEELKSREEVILAIMKLAKELDIRFAFPTSTVHVEDFPEKKSLTPKHDESPDKLKSKVRSFLDRWQIGTPND